jgi:hypothetical protein
MKKKLEEEKRNGKTQKVSEACAPCSNLVPKISNTSRPVSENKSKREKCLVSR